LYRRAGAAAVEVKRYPSATAVSVRGNVRTTDARWSVEDGQGYQAVRLLDDGTLEVVGLRIVDGKFAVVDPAGTELMHVDFDDETIISLAHGSAYLRLLDSGTLEVKRLETPAATVDDLAISSVGNLRPISGPEARACGGIRLAVTDAAGNFGWVPDPVQLPGGTGDRSYLTGPAPFAERGPWEITHHICYGQSNSTGGGTDVPMGTLRFNVGRVTGNNGVYNPATQAANHTAFVAGKSTIPDSAASGYLYELNRMARIDYGVTVETDSVQFLTSCPGKAGVGIATLSKPANDIYRFFIDDVTYGKALADAIGKSFGVGSVTWLQGEGDANHVPNKDLYKTRLKTLVTDINADVKAITGQPHDIKLITWQLNKSNSEVLGTALNTQIPMAQLEASEEDERILLSVPAYIFDHADEWHQTAAHLGWIGAYNAIAYAREAYQGKRHRPLSPKRIWRSGRFVLIQMHVGYLPLVLDEWRVGPTPDYGFELFTSALVTIPLIGVSIAHDTIKLETSDPVPAGAVVRYAFQNLMPTLTPRLTGQRGNLRDSQGDYLPKYLGNLEMHNPCVKFERSIT
jgi:hypothetical protein